MSSFIIAYGAALPDRIVTNDEIAASLSVTPDWIEANSGIRERRWASAEQSTSDLAAAASIEALASANMKAEKLDYLIGGTLSPDYQVPGIAPLVQRKLAGCREVPAVDLRVGCVTILYCLQLAHGLIKSGIASNLLCFGAEAQSKGLLLNKESAELSMLFGDGAGAFIMSNNLPAEPNNNAVLEVVDILIGSDGSFAEDLSVKAPGTANGARWIDGEQLSSGLYQGAMNGRKVILQAVRKMAGAANEILKRNNISLSQIDLIVPHQANLNLLRTLGKQLSVDMEKLVINIDRFGNTSGASAFLALAQAQQQQRLHQADYVLMLAFGAGFTWGSALCRVVK